MTVQPAVPPQVRPESAVTYSVSEMFDKMDRRFDKQDGTLDTLAANTATKDDVREMRHDITSVVGRVDKLEDHAASVVASMAFRRRAWGVAATVTGFAAVIVGSIIARGGHL